MQLFRPLQGAPMSGTKTTILEKDARMLCKEGRIASAIDAVVILMNSRGYRVSSGILYRLLQGCIEKKSLRLGRKVHQLIVRSGYVFDAFLGSHLIRMFSECGSLAEAVEVFDELPENTVYTWSAVIFAYAKYRQGEEAMKLFSQMQQQSGIVPNVYTIVGVLKACSSVAIVSQGRLVHALAVEYNISSDMYICNSLIDMYAKCGELSDAHILFDRLEARTMVTWNALLLGYAQHGHGKMALYIFKQMQHQSLMPDRITFIALLKACSTTKTITSARLVHSYIIEVAYDMDDFIETCLLDVYTKCGDLADAKNIFDNSLSEHCVVTWNTMILGYVQGGAVEEGLELFGQMLQGNILPDNATFISVMKACGILNAIDHGRLMHAQIVECDIESCVLMGNNLLDMYAKCGSIEDACSVFQSLPKHDIVTCTAMIGAHVHGDNNEAAIQLFQKMQHDGLHPNEVTFSSVLKACSRISAIELGKLLHADILMCDIDMNVSMGSSLIDMYMKCGNMEDASTVFNNLSERNVVAWSVMISGYAMHGLYNLALEFFKNMQHDGLQPDDITILCVLSACNQLGLVDEGYHQYRTIFKGSVSGLSKEHYTCLNSLLVHSGCPNEAANLSVTMPSPSDVVGWLSLLHDCKRYGNLDLAKGCFDNAATKDGGHTAAYVLMANLYSEVDTGSCVERVDKLRRFANVWKKAGKASIEIKDQLHNFTVGNIECENIDIQLKLNRIAMDIRRAGYVPHLNLVSPL